jgi:hypothetical protein
VISTIVLGEPQAAGQTVRFSWTISPENRLTSGTTIELSFPAWIPVDRVPRGLLWIAALALLHPLWILLRPCVVRFPFTLSPAEAEFWQRLLDTEIATLEALRGTAFHERCIAFAYDGPELAAPQPLPELAHAAAAFSGGKDALVQAAVLAELGLRPTLVTTTSACPPLEDERTERRAFVLRETADRLDVPLAEVRSNARALWCNGNSARLGFPLPITGMTDTHLFFASTLIAGVATGATHLFLASEADVQTNAIRDGRMVQITHYMYSVVTQAGLSALLAPWNLRYSSVISPLFNSQVQRLLWTRYPALADLQYSCWRTREHQSNCNECSQCLRVVMGILAAGADPRTARFDSDRVLARASEWFPKRAAPSALPDAHTTARLTLQLIETVRAIDPSVARAALGDTGFDAFRAFAHRLSVEPVGAVGMRPAFGAFLDPVVRDGALGIYRQAFPGDASDDDLETAARTSAAIDHITEPLVRGG